MANIVGYMPLEINDYRHCVHMHAYVYIHSICIEPVMSKANQGNMGLFAGETYDFSYAIHFATVAFRGKKTGFPSI